MEESLQFLTNPFEHLKAQLQRLGRVYRSRLITSFLSSEDLASVATISSSHSIPNDPGTPQHKAKPKRSSSQFPSTNQPLKNYTRKLKTVFEDLYKEYGGTDWVRKFENKKYLHIVVVKQFWYDSHVYLNIMHKKLLTPIKSKAWVHFDDFVQSMEGVHIKRSPAFLFIPIPSPPKFKVAKRIQKMLFYFAISSEGNKKITNEKILEVLLLARRKKQGWALAQSTLRLIIEKNRTNHSFDEILFEDFKKIIVSIDN